MANMFSDNTQKKVPRKFADCTQPDDVSTNLWIWAERLERVGKILFVIIILAGIFFTLNAAIEAQQLRDAVGAYSIEEIRMIYAEYGIEIPTIYEAIINSLLQWAFYAFLEYCTYHAIALLIGALATITQNTAITANVALYNAQKGEALTSDTPVKAPIKAPERVCEKPAEAEKAPAVTPTPAGAEKVTCPKCGKTQFGNRKTCWSCGAQMNET